VADELPNSSKPIINDRFSNGVKWKLDFVRETGEFELTEFEYAAFYFVMIRTLDEQTDGIIVTPGLVLLHCPKYSSFRDRFYRKLEYHLPYIKRLSTLEATKELMNSDNYFVNIQLLRFILSC